MSPSPAAPQPPDRAGNTPILLLNPADVTRTRTLAALSAMPGTIYHPLRESESRLVTATAGILEQIDPEADRRSFDSAANAGRALAATLTRHAVSRLILDGADYLNDPLIPEWLAPLAQWLGTSQLIVAGRALRLSEWQPVLDSQQARIWSPAETADPFPRSDRLIVSGFGHGAVWSQGQIAESWDGPLARRLFYYLIDQSPVRRDQVFAIYWADLSTREATNVFHVTKRKVNETVGYEVMLFQNRHYVINPAISLSYDVHTFERAIREAEAFNVAGDLAGAVARWADAVRLYRQPFLSNEPLPWIVQRRNQLRAQYADALAGLARAAQDNRDDDRALVGWLRALAEMPLREEWTIEAMRLLAAQGDLTAARDQYERLAEQLADQSGTRPGPAVVDAYRTLIGHLPD